jgi:DNA-binding NarL/FixJ family response regulator
MSNSKQRKRILIVDDHPVVREGLAARISAQADLEVCGEAEDVEQALAEFAATAPDLVIVDISLKTGHGLELIKQIKTRDPKAKALVISAYDESIYAERALRAGALGYIGKQECRENVIVAIRTVLDGRRYLSPQTTDRLVGLAVDGHASQTLVPTENLTDREMEVFQLIGQGRTTSAIANQLHLSPHTVESHRAKIKTKLKLSSGAELTRQAIQWVMEHQT